MRKIVALLAVVGGSLILAASATATEPAKGVNFQCGFSTTVLSEMQTAGTVWTRVGVDWGGDPTAGHSLEWAGENIWDQTYLSYLASCFTAIHSYGSNILVVLGQGTPSWASQGTACTTGGNCPPSNDQYYEEAAAELAQQFPASNSTDGINAFEFWDEPDSSVHWAGTPQQYGSLVPYGNAGVKAYSTATTVFGGTHHFNYTWLSQAIPLANKDFDVLGAHPYPTLPATYYDNPAHYLNDGTNSSLSGYLSLLHTYGPNGSNTPIWFTESGFIVDSGSQLSFSQIATGLTDQFHYLATSGCTGCSNVKQDDWFTAWWPGPPAGQNGLYDPQALLGYDANFTPNAPYYALENINPCYPSICVLPPP